MTEVSKSLNKIGINISESILAIVAIIFGILVIAFPFLISYILGIFLIIEGVLLLVKYFEKQRKASSN